MIISIVSALSLAPQPALVFAPLLVCLKLMVGAFLLATIMCAVYERLRWGSCDDAMLDVALLISALARAASALPGLTHGGEMLNEIIGELMLCLIASGLAIHGRGYPYRTNCRARRGRSRSSSAPARPQHYLFRKSSTASV